VSCQHLFRSGGGMHPLHPPPVSAPECIRQTSNKVFTESNATNRHQALARSQKNILKPNIQARNQLGTPGWEKSFLRGVQIFKLCPILSKYVQHIFQGERNFRRSLLPRYGPAWSTGKFLSYCFCFLFPEKRA